MIYKNFYLSVIIRVILFGAAVYLFFYMFMINAHYITAGVTALVSFFILFDIFRLVNKILRHTNMFFNSIRYSDFSYNLRLPYNNRVFKKLNSVYKYVINEFKKIRDEREKQFRYFQNLVQHVGIGLIAYNQDGEIDLINNAAKKILKINSLRRINELDALDSELVKKLIKIENKEKILHKLVFNDELQQLVIFATDFYIGENKYKLISIQNIQQELEEKEIESWEKLIHVLTHEIMNSITPISSLASTTKSLLDNSFDIAILDKENTRLQDIYKAVQTIEKRSTGLHHFVKNYRKLTRIPHPNFQVFNVAELFKRIYTLLKTQMQENKIDFEYSIEHPNTNLTADINLIEQILINLLKNSREAMEGIEEPSIKLLSDIDEQGHQIIQVWDNGNGISQDIIDSIFIPFYTTKNTGTGIGLNVSRQIMGVHGGSLRVKSVPGEKTTFTLVF